MLKITDFIREFPVVTKTDRDVERPLVIEWLRNKHFERVLDIGCHSSAHEGGYAKEVRNHAKLYDGIDIIRDDRLDGILDHQFVGNANTYSLEQYECVLCVSTIEHAGLSTYKADYQKERMELFKRVINLSTNYVWISFPLGQPYVYSDQLAVIPATTLKVWEGLVSKYKVKQRYFYTQGAQAGHPWYEHEKRNVAVRIPYIDYVGNSSICVMEVEK